MYVYTLLYGFFLKLHLYPIAPFSCLKKFQNLFNNTCSIEKKGGGIKVLAVKN